MLPGMAAVRLAAVLPLVLAAALTAQNTSRSQVVVTVIDQYGAVIAVAHVGIIQLPTVIPNGGDWLHYALTAPEQASTEIDASGEATVGLPKGSYAITIFAPGFKRYVERIEIRDESSQSLRATLAIDPVPFGPGPVAGDLLVIPLEPTSLNVLIPLEPLQTVTFPRRARRRWMR